VCATGLLDLANAYCEPHLKQVCEQRIKHGITVDNAAMLYSAAIKYDAPGLKEFCFRFILNHMTAVTQTEAFMHLDESVTKNLIRLAAQFGAFKF
jgi:RCC1 and BTB domain-containing protein